MYCCSSLDRFPHFFLASCCIHVCMCMRVCMYQCKYVCMVCVPPFISEFLSHSCVYVCVWCVGMYLSMYVCVYVWCVHITHTRINAHYAYMHKCTPALLILPPSAFHKPSSCEKASVWHTYIHTYIYIYINIHTYTYTGLKRIKMRKNSRQNLRIHA
jgi:hypothetical protein